MSTTYITWFRETQINYRLNLPVFYMLFFTIQLSIIIILFVFDLLEIKRHHEFVRLRLYKMKLIKIRFDKI